MSKSSILIYGPHGCGKTTNARALADFYDLTDIWENYELKAPGVETPREGTLLLAACIPPHAPPWLRSLPFTIAIKEACLAGWRQAPRFGLGTSQIIQILGIDPKRLIRFTLESDGVTSTLLVVQRPPESQSTGYITQRFNLVEIGDV